MSEYMQVVAAAEAADREGYRRAIAQYGSAGATYLHTLEAMRLWLHAAEITGDASLVRYWTRKIAVSERHRERARRVRALLALAKGSR